MSCVQFSKLINSKYLKVPGGNASLHTTLFFENDVKFGNSPEKFNFTTLGGEDDNGSMTTANISMELGKTYILFPEERGGVLFLSPDAKFTENESGNFRNEYLLNKAPVKLNSGAFKLHFLNKKCTDIRPDNEHKKIKNEDGKKSQHNRGIKKMKTTRKLMSFLVVISLFGCSKDIAENEKQKDATSETISTVSSLRRGAPCEKKADCKEDNEYCFTGSCLSDYPECLSGADCRIGNACILNTDEVCDGCLGKNLCFIDSFCDGEDFNLTCDMGTIPRAEDDFGTHDLVEQDSYFIDVAD